MGAGEMEPRGPAQQFFNPLFIPDMPLPLFCAFGKRGLFQAGSREKPYLATDAPAQFKKSQTGGNPARIAAMKSHGCGRFACMRKMSRALSA